MQCRACGTEIADKAIVCFRCGAPTMDAASERPGPATRGMRGSSGVGWAVMAGLLVGLAAAVVGYDGSWLRSVAFAAGGATGGLLWWYLRRLGRGDRRE
jgi:hypothetical protein